MLTATKLRLGTCYYDLERQPPSFNYVDFLLLSERWRLAQGYDTLEFIILPGPFQGFRRDNLPPAGGPERTRWLDNIVIPMSVLLPSCGQPGVKASGASKPGFGRGEYNVGFHTLVKSAEANCYPLRAPPELVASARQKYGPEYVTITHRDVPWWPLRRPQLQEWRRIAAALTAQGLRVVLIPDGTKADDPVEGFDLTDPEAGRNSLARAALYGGAVMNFGIPTGPMWMAWFMGVPTLIAHMSDERFDTIITGGRLLRPPTTVLGLSHSGLRYGDSLPNARPRQLLLWTDDTAENVLPAFAQLMAK